jgi:cell division protein FtsB
MSLKAWPFLVGKNRQTGYRPVVIPDILYAANVPGQLDRFRSNQVHSTPICKVVDMKRIGPVTAIYRVTHLTGADGSVYTDLQNRPIIWSEGILIRGNYPELELPAEVFRLVHQQLDAHAEEFYLNDHDVLSFTSKAFEIELAGEDIEETIRKLERVLAELRKQEKSLVNHITDLNRRARTGKTVTYVGIPLILIIVGLVVIPVGLYLSKSADNERKDPEADLETLREQIQQIEEAIHQLEKE